ncbi:hypothetical protein RHGRI_016647 [Rhododendron griersonianum]|uniref:RNase H type-1 domain-containing protein n=1 Tax=Rhododendron griersonianum TaxID=479676 RepID=A0AAV6JUV8_9ERIC|nr:hypothetical protein RHGRI_016647 [Rhododendron griersonianum]
MLATQRVIPHGTAMAYYLLLPIFEFLCLTAKVIKTQKGFLGSKKTLLRIKAQFSIWMHEWANEPTHLNGGRNDQKWQRPHHNRWKFNCDGVFNPMDKSVAFAVLVRDSCGSVVEINHGRIKVSSALAAEAWAIRIAISMARAWGKEDAIIESDCQVLVKLLQPNSSQRNWIIHGVMV